MRASLKHTLYALGHVRGRGSLKRTLYSSVDACGRVHRQGYRSRPFIRDRIHFKCDLNKYDIFMQIQWFSFKSEQIHYIFFLHISTKQKWMRLFQPNLNDRWLWRCHVFPKITTRAPQASSALDAVALHTALDEADRLLREHQAAAGQGCRGGAAPFVVGRMMMTMTTWTTATVRLGRAAKRTRLSSAIS